eukprot:TRINITY_DN950_c0_g1_i3.p1 TRINITY_DN950_c0_g1~~TRINITY_DN950_c0_g1_i3.p1  ORF type:complete len:160 (+),score=31.13 TRINITY_DN950_c0_g1_i3:136-615(+)
MRRQFLQALTFSFHLTFLFSLLSTHPTLFSPLLLYSRQLQSHKRALTFSFCLTFLSPLNSSNSFNSLLFSSPQDNPNITRELSLFHSTSHSFQLLFSSGQLQSHKRALILSRNTNFYVFPNVNTAISNFNHFSNIHVKVFIKWNILLLSIASSGLWGSQ